MTPRTAWRPVLAALLAVAAAPALSAGPASAARTGPASAAMTGHRLVDDRRVVQATRDGSALGASRLGVHRTRTTGVDATNAAVAYASCDGCRAVALSFQVVIAERGPLDVAADNLALAVTEGCTGCEALALAYQVVVTSPGRAHISDRGHRRLESVRHRLRSLAHSRKPLTQVRSEASALMGVVAKVMTEELRTRPTVHAKERWERREPAQRR